VPPASSHFRQRKKRTEKSETNQKDSQRERFNYHWTLVGLLQIQHSWCPLPQPKIQFRTLNKSAGENWGKIAYKQAEKLFRDNKDISEWAGLSAFPKLKCNFTQTREYMHTYSYSMDTHTQTLTHTRTLHFMGGVAPWAVFLAKENGKRKSTFLLFGLHPDGFVARQWPCHPQATLTRGEKLPVGCP